MSIIQDFRQVLIVSMFFTIFMLPFFVSAQGNEVVASCTLTVTTSRGEVEFEGTKNKVIITSGDEATVTWDGDNAVSAKDGSGKKIDISGSLKTGVLTKKKTYIFRFKGDEGKDAICSVIIQPVNGGMGSLGATTAKPTITGTVTGLKTVVVTVSKDSFSKELYRSKPIKVKNGSWTLKLPITLTDGSYHVGLYAPEEYKLGYIVTGILTVSANASPLASLVTTIPAGKSVGSGSEVLFETVTVKNISKGTVSINSFFVMETGSVKESVVIGLGVAEGGGGTGGIEGYTPFKNGLAGIPILATLMPGETRTFTLSAKLSKNIPSSELGKEVQIRLYQISTNAKLIGSYASEGAIYKIQ